MSSGFWCILLHVVPHPPDHADGLPGTTSYVIPDGFAKRGCECGQRHYQIVCITKSAFKSCVGVVMVVTSALGATACTVDYRGRFNMSRHFNDGAFAHASSSM